MCGPTPTTPRRVLKRADGLIAVSENSRRDVIRVLGIPENRVVTIHPGVAPRFFGRVPGAAGSHRTRPEQIETQPALRY